MTSRVILSVLFLTGGLLFTAGKLAAQDLYVGSNTPNQSTNFSSGTNAYGNTWVGYSNISTNNSLTVDGNGSGTQLTNSVNLYVGNNGSANSLTITNAGAVYDAIGYVGNNASASNNSALVTGTNSVWSNSSLFYVGNNGSGNNLTISNGASVYDTYAYVAQSSATSSNNGILVTGTGSLWSNSGSLNLGTMGSSNTLTISFGGKVANAAGNVGSSNGANNNSILVTGSGSLWSNAVLTGRISESCKKAGLHF